MRWRCKIIQIKSNRRRYIILHRYYLYRLNVLRKKKKFFFFAVYTRHVNIIILFYRTIQLFLFYR